MTKIEDIPDIPGIYAIRRPTVEIDVKYEGDLDWIEIYNPEYDDTVGIAISSKCAADLMKRIAHWWHLDPVDNPDGNLDE